MMTWVISDAVKLPSLGKNAKETMYICSPLRFQSLMVENMAFSPILLQVSAVVSYSLYILVKM